MMWTITCMILILNLSFNSPYSSTLLLIISSIQLGLMFLSVYANWLFYSVIILFVGGMMILFIYICCISVSPKFKMKNTLYLIPYLASGIFLSMITYSMGLYSPIPWSLYMILTTNSMSALMMLGVYLLLGLLVATKLASKLAGPLKSFKYD